MHDDERRLLDSIQGGTDPRTAVHQCHIDPDRAATICRGWSRHGWYRFEGNVLEGELTSRGRKVPTGMSNTVELSLNETIAAPSDATHLKEEEATEDASIQRQQWEGMES